MAERIPTRASAQLVFIFEAEDELEDLLLLHCEGLARAIITGNVCAYHTGTTLDAAGACAMCDLDERYAAQAPAPRWWERPMPVKDYTGAAKVNPYTYGTKRAQ